MNVTEAADELGVSARTVRRRIKSGKLAATKDGARVVIEPAEIERYKREEREPLGPHLPPPDLTKEERDRSLGR